MPCARVWIQSILFDKITVFFTDIHIYIHALRSESMLCFVATMVHWVTMPQTLSRYINTGLTVSSLNPRVRLLPKNVSRQSRHVFSMMAGITIILLHFPAVRQPVYCTAMRYHFNLEERKRGGRSSVWCFLLASIVSWELIKMRLQCCCSSSRRTTPPHTTPHSPHNTHRHHHHPQHTRRALYASLLA